MLLDDSTVAIACGQAAYPEQPPYSPHEAGPEYPFGTATLSDQPNPAYAGVRETLRLLELDADHYGTAAWNPLRGIAEPGDMVVLKPNFVREFRETHAGHGNCLFTHGAVLRAVLDYVFLATEGSGRIVIADAPHNDADFDALVRLTGLRELQAFYRRHADFDVEVYDLRPERARKIDGVIVGHDALPGDPAGYVKVDLGAGSAFAEINHLCHLLYGSEYDTSELVSHHHGDVHEYLIARTILDADCVISLPKLKTHKKVGLTVNMKNLVGINGNKNWLPHHREGTPSQGGDQFADDAVMHRAERAVVAGFKRIFPMLGPVRTAIAGPIKALGKRIFGDTNSDTIRSGNWYGNDTTWRMVLDLNRILFYADSAGALHDEPVRRLFSIVDGIIAGEGNGPLGATAKPTGLIVAGANPVAVDLTCARVMGFDRCKLPVLRRAFCDHTRPLAVFDIDSVTVRSDDIRFARPLQDYDGAALAFEPHFGWTGHVELVQPAGST